MDATVSLGFDPAREEQAGLLWDLPLAQLQTVKLELGEDDTIRQACERGADLLIPELARRLATERYHEYGLGMGASEGSELPPVYVDELMLLDGDGQVIWGVGDFRSTTFRQLIRAHEAGLLPGNPLRLVLMSPQRGGGGVVIDWDSLLVVFDALWTAVSAVATVHGAGEAIGWLRRRLARGRGVVRERFPAWSSRGAHTHTLERLLYCKRWTAEELAERLRIPSDEAAGLLALYGFAETSAGTWELGSDEPAILLREVIDSARRAYADSSPNRLELEQLLQSKLASARRLSEVRISVADLPSESIEVPEGPAEVDPVETTIALLAHMARRLDEIAEALGPKQPDG